MRQRRLTCIVLLVGAILLGGCSTYQGHKIAQDGSLAVEPTGIPFQMTRPEYTIKITPKKDEKTAPFYTLVVDYIPDATQRYTLTLDPAFLTDGDFTLNLDTNGNITDGTSVLSEQVTPFVTSLGSFASNILGSIAVLDKQTVFAEMYNTVENKASANWDTEKKSFSGTYKDQDAKSLVDALEREIKDKDKKVSYSNSVVD